MGYPRRWQPSAMSASTWSSARHSPCVACNHVRFLPSATLQGHQLLQPPAIWPMRAAHANYANSSSTIAGEGAAINFFLINPARSGWNSGKKNYRDVFFSSPFLHRRWEVTSPAKSRKRNKQWLLFCFLLLRYAPGLLSSPWFSVLSFFRWQTWRLRKECWRLEAGAAGAAVSRGGAVWERTGWGKGKVCVQRGPVWLVLSSANKMAEIRKTSYICNIVWWASIDVQWDKKNFVTIISVVL